MAPRYDRPSLPVPDRYPSDAPVPAGAPVEAVTPLDWHQVFVDPALQSVIETSLHNNRDLRRAVLQVSEARAQWSVAGASRWPGINGNAVGARARIPEGEVPGLGGVISAYEIAASASWELDFWGRVRNLDTAALESYLATDAARRAFTISLAAQVADAWLQQRELDDRIALAQASIVTRTETFRIFRRRYEEGSGNRLELTQAETLLTQAQALGKQLEQARAINHHALSLLMGVPASTDLRAVTFDTQESVRVVAAQLPSALLTHRPDILAAEHRLKAAHANIGAARAAFFPQVMLTGSIGTASSQLDGLFDAGTRTWAFLPTITVPIFNAGRLRSNLELARVRRDIAVAGYEATIQGAFRDVADALSAQQSLTEQVDIQRRALTALTERARLAQLRYDSGAATYLEVLDAQRDLLVTQQTLVQTQRAVQSTRVSLFAALGGGSLGESGS
jgi:multidrug efflux system outer membrane protein